jgi:hypothetical protein
MLRLCQPHPSHILLIPHANETHPRNIQIIILGGGVRLWRSGGGGLVK